MPYLTPSMALVPNGNFETHAKREIPKIGGSSTGEMLLDCGIKLVLNHLFSQPS